MKLYGRSLVAIVLLFTAVAVTMLWGLNKRSQGELIEQVIERAGLRSAQLADAMAGQVGAELALMDHALLDVRKTLLRDPTATETLNEEALGYLPDGLVVSMNLMSADGRVVYSSHGVGLGVNVSDRPHFKAMLAGDDRLVIGGPSRPSKDSEWLIPVGRPVYRDGRFAGAIFLVMSSERMAHRLGELALAEDDTVALIHPSGEFLARSLNNQAAMGQSMPDNRPFMKPGAGSSGTFRLDGLVDGVSRVFGWKRLEGSGVIVAVGLSKSSVMAPLASTVQRSHWLTGLLSLLLVAGGCGVAWVLWRIDRSSRAVSESEQRLKDAQRLAKVGNWSLDLRTREFVWSDEVYRIMGMRRGTDGTAYSDIYQRVHLDDRAGFEEAFDRAIKEGVRMDVAHRVVLPDGSVKHVHALGLFETENGEAVRCHGTVQDVTEVRAAQLAMEQLKDALEVRVEVRTRELASLNKELEAFAYSVSHDLRTPLRSIHGFASLLEDESDKLSIEGRTHLRRIQDGARRMGLLITDLLTMAHQSRAVVNLEHLNLSELAQAVAQDIGRDDPQRKVAWQIEPELWACADPVLMRVVLQNLLGNAWKYTGQTAQAEIALRRVGKEGDMVEFCVRDNGAGFDMAYVDQLFQPFKRLHAHHEFEGSGVGLASVQRLIQRHGGTVRAQGQVGQGAAFYFTLPCEPGSLSPEEETGEEAV